MWWLLAWCFWSNPKITPPREKETPPLKSSPGDDLRWAKRVCPSEWRHTKVPLVDQSTKTSLGNSSSHFHWFFPCCLHSLPACSLERAKEDGSNLRRIPADPCFRGDAVCHQRGVIPAARLPLCHHHLQVRPVEEHTDRKLSCLWHLSVCPESIRQ